MSRLLLLVRPPLQRWQDVAIVSLILLIFA